MIRWIGCALVLAAVVGCDWMPGRPKIEDAVVPPHQITDFSKLVTTNCRGCHGIDGTVAGSFSLDDPLYYAVANLDAVRNVVARGVEATTMPSFALSEGGTLTDQQINIIVNGLFARAAETPVQGPLPPYSAPLGTPAPGKAAFGTYCASCHGADGTGGTAGSLVDPAYLGITSNQYLRTITIIGRKDLGCPDFRSRVPGQAMSDQEIADVVAWLDSQRVNEFGKPATLGKR